LGIKLGTARSGFQSDSFDHLNFINIASFGSTAASAVFVAIGILRLREGRRSDAYRMFDHALLISIFLTRVFAFVESQFGAVFGLGIDLLLLSTLRYAAAQERRKERAQSVTSTPGEPVVVA
jgi:hypothetical protein